MWMRILLDHPVGRGVQVEQKTDLQVMLLGAVEEGGWYPVSQQYSID